MTVVGIRWLNPLTGQMMNDERKRTTTAEALAWAQNHPAVNAQMVRITIVTLPAGQE